ncbi:MAG: Na-K-Cl cotransporter [Geitlerinemataceae cyanobacterium]
MTQSNSRPPRLDPTERSGLGTFGGVYTPSVLTILGVIMYLRFGWVVANVGWGGALAIVTLATSITLLTGLSISSIATDRVVRVGGAYYIISRSLGLETGGAVGVPLYFAQAISVALYTIGFVESLTRNFPTLEPYQLWLNIGTTLAVTLVAATSASFAIKTQYFIMAAIALSLLSFIFGSPVGAQDVGAWGVEGAIGEPFWVVFAVFFPAVTGIMAGVNMSGDLEDPSKSIPTGTLGAIATGYVIYMALPLLLAGRADSETLLNNPLVMRDVAVWGDAILLGIWGATLSSALGSILGAPRVLQALARDGVLPRFMRSLGKGSGPDDEPRLGTLVTLAVAIAAVCVGDLNKIAPVLTMFFLTTYMVLNVAAAIEGFLQSPSFRPTFRVPWLLSALGALGCLGVMLAIDAAAAIVAAIFVLLLYLWLERREMQSAWGDVRRGLWMELVRMGVFNLDGDLDPKNWRPHVLVFSGAPMRRWPLIELASMVTHNRGLVTVSSVLPSGSRDPAQQHQLEAKVRDYLVKRNVNALVRIVTASNPFDGAEKLVEAYGLGSLVPNTIVLGDSERIELRESFCGLIATLHRARRSVLVLRDNPERGFGQRQRIDVWWRGLQANGSLMLLLAYLIQTESRWNNADISLKLVVANESAARSVDANLRQMIDAFRIRATAKVSIADDRPFRDILHESSRDADLVFLGIARPEGNAAEFCDRYAQLQALAAGLPTTIFVLAAAGFAFEEVLDQDGETQSRF